MHRWVGMLDFGHPAVFFSSFCRQIVGYQYIKAWTSTRLEGPERRFAGGGCTYEYQYLRVSSVQENRAEAFAEESTLQVHHRSPRVTVDGTRDAVHEDVDAMD